MDISKLTLVELKALAYDLAVQLQVINQNVSVVNQEIQKRIQEPPVPPVRSPENTTPGTYSLVPSEESGQID